MTKVPWPIRRIHSSPFLFETSRRLDFSLFWWRESYYTTVYPSFMIIAFSLLILLHLALYVSTHKQSIMIFILSNLNKICDSSHPISCSTIFTSFTSCYINFFSFMSSRAQSVDCFPLQLNCFCLFCFRILTLHNDGHHIETCQTWREAFLLNFGDFLVLTSIPVKRICFA